MKPMFMKTSILFCTYETHFSHIGTYILYPCGTILQQEKWLLAL